MIDQSKKRNSILKDGLPFSTALERSLQGDAEPLRGFPIGIFRKPFFMIFSMKVKNINRVILENS